MVLDYSSAPRGFKRAFVKGFGLVNPKATHILTMDADLNHRPEEIMDLIRETDRTGSEVVIGSRYVKTGRVERLALWKRAVSVFANLVFRILWGLRVKDKTSGYRLYKKEVIEKIVPLCKSSNFEFLFEILILANRLGYKISEVPIVFQARKSGKSKFRLFKVVGGYISLIIKQGLGRGTG